MGQDVRQDWAISIGAMQALMVAFERAWGRAVLLEDKDEVVTSATYAVIAFCGSLRGNKVFLVDLAGLRRYLQELKEEDFVLVPLLGRYKGEQHSRYHLAPMAARMNSGLEVKVWIQRLVQVRERQGQLQGPAFQDGRGNFLNPSKIEGHLVDHLQAIKESQPGVIPAEVDCAEHFRISRSFRRGAASAARARGVSDRQVELINRWRKVEHAKGCHPSLPMIEHYSDIQALVPEMVKFSQAL